MVVVVWVPEELRTRLNTIRAQRNLRSNAQVVMIALDALEKDPQTQAATMAVPQQPAQVPDTQG